MPPPFNVIPTPKSIFYMCRWLHRKLCGHSRAAKKEHMRTIRVCTDTFLNHSLRLTVSCRHELYDY